MTPSTAAAMKFSGMLATGSTSMLIVVEVVDIQFSLRYRNVVVDGLMREKYERKREEKRQNGDVGDAAEGSSQGWQELSIRALSVKAEL